MFIPLAIDILEETEAAANIVMPTAPTFALLVTPVFASLGTFFLSFSFSHIFLSLYYEFFPSFLYVPHAIFHVPSQVRFLLRCLRLLGLRLAAVPS